MSETTLVDPRAEALQRVPRERMIEAFLILCDWANVHPDRRNTVVAMGLDDLLRGRDSPMVHRARQFAESNRERSRGRS